MTDTIDIKALEGLLKSLDDRHKEEARDRHASTHRARGPKTLAFWLPIVLVVIPLTGTMAVTWGSAAERMETHEKRIKGLETHAVTQQIDQVAITRHIAMSETMLKQIVKSLDRIYKKLDEQDKK